MKALFIYINLCLSVKLDMVSWLVSDVQLHILSCYLDLHETVRLGIPKWLAPFAKHEKRLYYGEDDRGLLYYLWFELIMTAQLPFLPFWVRICRQPITFRHHRKQQHSIYYSYWFYTEGKRAITLCKWLSHIVKMIDKSCPNNGIRLRLHYSIKIRVHFYIMTQ